MKKIIYSILILVMISGCKDKAGIVDGSGRFEADEIVVSAEVSGKIAEMDIEEGMLLPAGKIVGIIDTMQLYFQKMRLLTGSEAVRLRRADVSKQIGALKQQISNLQNERVRAAKLVSLNAGNRKSLDDIDYQISTLERQIIAQQSALERGNLSADKESAAIEIQVAQTEDLIEKSLIKSAITGQILTKYASKGEFRAAGQPLFRVADTEKMYLRAYLSNSLISAAKIGTKAIVFSGSDETIREYNGEIVWISEEAEFTPKNVINRDERSNLVYAVKILVKNDGYIKSGMYGDFKLVP